jgi:hypothetical protein
MKTEKRQIINYTLAIILAVVFALGFSAVQTYAQSVDSGEWPMWPEPTQKINDSYYAIQEPATFLSIGREIVPWPFFGETTVDANNNLNIVGSDLFFTIEEFSYDGGGNRVITAYRTVSPNAGSGDDLFMVFGNSTIFSGDIDNEDILEGLDAGGGAILPGLKASSVFPEFVADWISYGEEPNVIHVANESFISDFNADQYRFLNGWKTFLVQNLHIGDRDFFFADSGHAPPQMVWPFDSWLYEYRTKTGYSSGPSAWEDRYVCLWPTNQGSLQAFETYNVDVPDSVPYVNRKWLAVPNPSFRQSIYQQLRRVYSNNQYKRMTVLDGPVTIRDVQIGGQWKRIAVGTTGIGTKQTPKPQNAWTILQQSQYDPSTSVPAVSDKGRAFGLYAFDITGLGATATTAALESLWSVSNVFSQTSANSFSDIFVENNTGTAVSSYSAFADMRFSVSKPLMGYTKDANGNMTWHVIILGVDKQNRYLWLDLKPEDGSVRRSGFFINGFTGNPETLQAASFVDFGSFSGEDVENVFPSRILAAFPPPDSQYREPILSDVYVHLSNGAVYRWDLNPANTAPEWIVTLKSDQAGQIAPPVTDFDISYITDPETKEVHTYFATNVLLRSVRGQASLDTESLVILDLKVISAMAVADRNTIRVPPGQDGSVVSSRNPHILVVQLELNRGTSTTDSKTVLASPVFIDQRLFLAFYELSRQGQGQGGQSSMISRLYTMLFGSMMGSGNVQHLEEAEFVDGNIVGDYFDYSNVEAAMMFIDSLGNLVLLDSEGNVIGDPIPTGLDLAQSEGSGGSGPYSNPGTHIVYWKTM